MGYSYASPLARGERANTSGGSGFRCARGVRATAESDDNIGASGDRARDCSDAADEHDGARYEHHRGARDRAPHYDSSDDDSPRGAHYYGGPDDQRRGQRNEHRCSRRGRTPTLDRRVLFEFRDGSAD